MMSALLPRALACSLLLAGSAQAQQAAPRPFEQRLHEEVQAVLLRLIESGELRAEDAEALSLVSPVSQQVDFGAIVDVRYRSGQDSGLPVLGVTPGGSAERLGLKSGDRLVAVNGKSLLALGGDERGRALAAQRLRDEFLASPDQVELLVVRDGSEVALRGAVQVVSLPAYRLDLGAALAQASLAATAEGDDMSRCGRISVFDIASRRQQLYRAVLIAIDGKLPGPASSESYRLEPGTHTLTVAEAIDSHKFSATQVFERGRLGRERYKTLTVEVQPGITYRLASRFHPEERGRIRDGAYWEPTIWKESPEACR